MKKFIAAAVAMSLIGTSAMAAPYNGGRDRGHAEQSYRQHTPHQADNGKRFSQNRYAQQNRYTQWKKGDRFDRKRAANYRVIDKPRNYRLNTPPRGYQWVRSGNDAVLVGITSGIVAAILANALR